MPAFYTKVAQIPTGETLQWSGSAPRGLMFRRSDIGVIPFSILWFGFSLFWEGGVAYGHGPIFALLYGAAFNVFGLYFFAGRFVVDAMVRARTTYALTDSAAYVILPDFAGGMRRFGPEQLADATISLGKFGYGSIRLAPSRWEFMPENSHSRRPLYASFERIANAAQVYDKVVAISAASRMAQR